MLVSVASRGASGGAPGDTGFGGVAFDQDVRAVYTGAGAAALQRAIARRLAGYDTAASWSGADAVMKRLEWANTASQRISAMGSPSDFLDRALGPIAGDATCASAVAARRKRRARLHARPDEP